MPAKKHNRPTTFAKIKIGDAFHLNGTWWVKKSSRTAYLWEMPHTWFYFSKDDLVFSDEKESKAHERSQKPRYLNPRKNPWDKRSWGYLGYGAMENLEIAENANARDSGGRWRLQSPTGYGRWKVHGNGTLAEMKQLAKKLKSKPKRKASTVVIDGIDLGVKARKPSTVVIDGIDLGVKARKNTRRRTRPYALQEIAMKKKKSKR